ncbi:hypothetical protein NS506_02644 [Nocardia seriolae]|uniref:Uncharacterized protein n=1 Tax=Nocardia seriolae TaxID=37332 RepID=A0ABC8ARI3_9NOCA|nr:hypothetical protein [Nocardia seriolae]APA96706.1 hypothetical protein NS506_02644 [Nocardia seriolae]
MTGGASAGTDPDGIYAYRPVRDANSAHFQFARLHEYDDGQAIAHWGTEARADQWEPITVDLIDHDSDGIALRPARMPYLDIGTLLFDGDDAIDAAARILRPYGELLPVRTTTGRTDLAVFHAFGLIGWGDEREHLNEFSYGVYLYLSPKDSNEIRRLGAFRHEIDPYGALFLSDELVRALGRAGLIEGTAFRICAPRLDSCG